MPRQEDLDDFYEIMHHLELIVDNKRKLSTCNGNMNWPKRGIYFFYEESEKRDNGEPRVVRVGTHAIKVGSKSTLWNRLSQHQGTKSGMHPGGGNHRGSIFRLHVGTAIIEKFGFNKPTWSHGSTAKGTIREKEYPIEKLVSQHIGQMPFLWLKVNDKPGPDSIRRYIEYNAIGLLSNYGKKFLNDQPSASWLGNYAWNNKVRESGLWNVNDVDRGYDPIFLKKMRELVEEMNG